MEESKQENREEAAVAMGAKRTRSFSWDDVPIVATAKKPRQEDKGEEDLEEIESLLLGMMDGDNQDAATSAGVATAPPQQDEKREACLATVQQCAEMLMHRPALRRFIWDFVKHEKTVNNNHNISALRDENENVDWTGEHETVKKHLADIDSGHDCFSDGSMSDEDVSDIVLHERNIRRHLSFVTKMREEQGGIFQQNGNGTVLPVPPSEPSPSAVLVALGVHFSRDKSPSCQQKGPIEGFDMIYSDKTRVIAGTTEHTTIANVELQDGEHINGFQARYSRIAPRTMYAIRFRTTWGRWLHTRPQSSRVNWESGEPTGPDTEQRMAPGHILRSIEPKAGQNERMFEFKAAPLPEPTTQQAGGIPSLESLAHKTLEEHLKKRACQLHSDRMSRLLDLRVCDADLRTIHKRHAAKLQQSQEMKMVRISEEVAKCALRELEDKKWELLNQAHCEKKLLRFKRRHQQTKEEKKSDLDQISLYKEHRYFQDACAAMSAENEDNAVPGSGLALCTFPSCRATYRPHDLPVSVRCVVNGCSSVFENCGCGIKTCRTCHKPVCLWHAEKHFGGCGSDAAKRCGYSETKGGVFRKYKILLPRFCHRPGKEMESCFSCLTSCCLGCRRACPHCGKVWCRRCLDPMYPPFHPCCVVGGRLLQPNNFGIQLSDSDFSDSDDSL